MKFHSKQTRSYPAEFTVSSPDLPNESVVVFSGDDAKGRAEQYAVHVSGPDTIDASTEAVAPKAA